MKNINIICMVVLSWVVFVNTNSTAEKAEEPIVNTEEVADEDSAVNFPRPRKPCPSGPGKK